MQTVMSCSEYRKRAQFLQATCDFDGAAVYYQRTIDTYPESMRVGELYQEDLRGLIGNRSACMAMSKRPNESLGDKMIRYGQAL